MAAPETCAFRRDHRGRQKSSVGHRCSTSPPRRSVRSYALEKELGLTANRRVWLKDYGWTPVGSFKLLGALNWMAGNLERIGERPVAAHSLGNFASGIAFAGMRYKKRVIVVMPDALLREV